MNGNVSLVKMEPGTAQKAFDIVGTKVHPVYFIISRC